MHCKKLTVKVFLTYGPPGDSSSSGVTFFLRTEEQMMLVKYAI